MEESQVLVKEWLNKRPDWLTHPIEEIVSGKEVSLVKIEKYAELCLQSAKKKKVERKQVNLTKEYFNESSDRYSLTSIKNVKGVNALSECEKLELLPNGINIIFGKNGSGKSGYMRLLKMISNSKYSESIKGNIYSTNKSKQECTIEIEDKEAVKKDFTCDLSSGNEVKELETIQTFDTPTSLAYIGEANESSYEPLIFSMLSKLADVSNQVRIKLAEKENIISISEIVVPSELRSNALLQKVNELNSKSVFAENDYKYGELEKQRVLTLTKEVNEQNPEKKIKRVEIKRKQLNEIKVFLNEMLEFFKPSELTNIKNVKIKNEEALLLQEEFSKKFETSANKLDKTSLSESSWEKMWKYAKKYSEIISLPNGTCPLCFQSMTGDTCSRFNNIEEFVNSENKKEIENSKKELDRYLDSLKRVKNHDEITIRVKGMQLEAENESILLNEVTKWIDKVEALSDEIKNKKIDVQFFEELNKEYITNEIFLSKVLKQLFLDLDQEKDILKSLLNFENLAIKQNELDDLLSKKFISENLIILNENIKKYKEIELIKESISLVSTNSLTLLSNKLAERLLTDKYIEKFNKELVALTSGKIKVDLKKGKSRKGKTPFKIVTRDDEGKEHEPNQILSEGEQRIVSLAAFLADSQTGEGLSPIIFDDPISSLDMEYEIRVINRLVDIAKNRQVVIFTHRLSLVHGIVSKAKEETVSYSDIAIETTGKTKGIPTEGIMSKITKIDKSIGMLIEKVNKVKDMDVLHIDYRMTIEWVCKEFRIIAEKTIERIFTEDIIKRNDPVIRSSNVMKLARITESDCKMVDEVMSEYSKYVHSQSDEIEIELIEIEKLLSDLTKYQAWAKDAAKRMKK